MIKSNKYIKCGILFKWLWIHMIISLRNTDDRVEGFPPLLQAKESSRDVCSATRRCDNRMGWSAAAFSASDQIHTSLQRLLTVQPYFSDDLHLGWTSPHTARTSYTSSWPERRSWGNRGCSFDNNVLSFILLMMFTNHLELGRQMCLVP